MQLKSRIVALPLAAVLASGAFFSSAPAQAAPKSKTYKAGAIALGALGAYFLSKGKTVEGAAALGGGYLAYRKGESERKDEKHNDRYGRYDGDRYYNDGNYNGGYYGGNYNNGGGYYGNGDYNGAYGDPYYNSNADYRYNNRNNDNDRDCRDNNSRNNPRGRNRSWRR